MIFFDEIKIKLCGNAFIESSFQQNKEKKAAKEVKRVVKKFGKYSIIIWLAMVQKKNCPQKDFFKKLFIQKFSTKIHSNYQSNFFFLKKMNTALIQGTEEDEMLLKDQQLKTVLLSECHNKNYFSKEQKIIKTFECLICGQIANNAMELICDAHDDQKDSLIIGQQCLINYLKNNNNQCPIDNHISCKYIKSKMTRQFINDLIIMCPVQFINQLNQKSNDTISKKSCKFEGKISEIKEHVEKSCPLKLVECEFKPFGCNEMFQHLKLQIEKHVHLLKSHIIKLEQEIQTLKNENIGSIEIEKKNQDNQYITEEQKEDDHNNFFHFKLLKTFDECNGPVRSVDYATFDNNQLLCFGSEDKTVRLWNIKTNEQIQSFNGHSMFDEHTNAVEWIEFSSFNNGRYLCSGSTDKTIRLWDIETSKSLHVFNGHMNDVLCVNFSPLQSNNDDVNNKINSIGIIGGNGYTICSGSDDNTIRIWDIESLKDVIVFKGHEDSILCVKYLPYESRISGGANIILSGSADQSVRLWDIRSNQQIQMFDEHTSV
ncbi:hypothetical protein RFI_39005, partial [Reticulomyxa filosa]